MSEESLESVKRSKNQRVPSSKKRRQQSQKKTKNYSNKRKSHNIEDIIDESDDNSSDTEIKMVSRPRKKMKEANTILIMSSDSEEEVKDSTNTEIVEFKVQKAEESKSLSLYECPICFESPKKTMAIPCGHLYCFDCLFAAFEHSRTNNKTKAVCALCRGEYTLNRTVPLKFKIGSRRPKKKVECVEV